MKVSCPICKKEIAWGETPSRPFCSERCRIIDLGDWAQGKYAVPDPHAESEPVPDVSDDNESDED